MRLAPSLVLPKTSSFPLRPVAYWSEANGNFPRRNLVGGSPCSNGVRSWFQEASNCRAMRRTKRESARHNCLCSADQQSQMGHGSRKCDPLGTSHGAAQGFCSQRFSNRHLGQGSPIGAGWETPASKTGVIAFRYRYCAWKVVLAPLLSHLTGSTRISLPVISPVTI